MCVCVYVCMYACMHMYARMHVCMHACMPIHYLCMYVCRRVVLRHCPVRISECVLLLQNVFSYYRMPRHSSANLTDV